MGCHRDWCTPWDWRGSRRIHFTDPCLALRILESFINCWPKEWRRRAGPAAAADPFMHKPASAGLHRNILRPLQASGVLDIKKPAAAVALATVQHRPPSSPTYWRTLFQVTAACLRSGWLLALTPDFVGIVATALARQHPALAKQQRSRASGSKDSSSAGDCCGCVARVI